MNVVNNEISIYNSDNIKTNITKTINKNIQIEFEKLVELLKDKEIRKMNTNEIDMYNSLFKISGYNISIDNYKK
jgi:hypothetical protein